MVFFHPGGFYEGSCSSAVYGPQYLLDEDVVLVVPNYRLASLGKYNAVIFCSFNNKSKSVIFPLN